MSVYDQVSSMLLALVSLLGIVVTIMLLVWLTGKIFLSQAPVQVELLELGDGDGPLGGSMELEGPLDEEIELQEPSVQDTLAAVADAVAAQAAMLDDPSLSDSTKRGRGGGGTGLGSGDGTGSGVARRWEVYFEGSSLAVYARQLDSFGIELAVLMPGNQVAYAYNLSKSRPDTRTGPADAEKRYYLTWRGGELQEADRALLSRAGIESQGRILLKFLPPAVEANLQNLEKTLKGSDPERIRRTRFGIRPQGDGYAFFVID
ncbi:MAG: hypothetical protein V3R99_10325 [Thermoguttaceae bacterium]